MSRPADTSPETHRRQVERYRSMTPAERLRLADEMSTEVQQLADAGRAHRERVPDDVGHAAPVAQPPLSFAALLADVIPRLDRAGVPYMVTGSLASSYYGEPRSTRDLDIVIDPDAASLERLVDELVEGRFYVDRDAALEALHDRSQFNAMDADATKIDFVIRKDRPFSVEEFGRRERADLSGHRRSSPRPKTSCCPSSSGPSKRTPTAS